MNSMPPAMTIALAEQHRSALLADADQRRLARAVRQTATGDIGRGGDRRRRWAPALLTGLGRRPRAWRGSPASTCA
jgi:hypothetical protein